MFQVRLRGPKSGHFCRVGPYFATQVGRQIVGSLPHSRPTRLIRSRRPRSWRRWRHDSRFHARAIAWGARSPSATSARARSRPRTLVVTQHLGARHASESREALVQLHIIRCARGPRRGGGRSRRFLPKAHGLRSVHKGASAGVSRPFGSSVRLGESGLGLTSAGSSPYLEASRARRCFAVIPDGSPESTSRTGHGIDLRRPVSPSVRLG